MRSATESTQKLTILKILNMFILMCFECLLFPKVFRFCKYTLIFFLNPCISNSPVQRTGRIDDNLTPSAAMDTFRFNLRRRCAMRLLYHLFYLGYNFWMGCRYIFFLSYIHFQIKKLKRLTRRSSYCLPVVIAHSLLQGFRHIPDFRPVVVARFPVEIGMFLL